MPDTATLSSGAVMASPSDAGTRSMLASPMDHASSSRRPRPTTPDEVIAALDAYHREVASVILAKQHPVTGLLPASTAITIHGNYTDAWVRDNVYSIYAVFALALAYRRVDDDTGKGFELEQSCVKNMRGLLSSMMKQSKKVQTFKHTQHPLDALHAKYSTTSGDTVVGDADWGHLQLDATGLFLLTLAQMTMSGLRVIYTLDEVDFVQNLTYYIERAYRTPDYGAWERGDKINHGRPELNSSSIGLALAALDAINGVNLFGARGGPASVIRVLEDEVARNRLTLEAALPRESSSKEVDAAVLAAISFPGFAVSDPEVVARTRRVIISKLQGRYGLKRFLRDGHQTAVEDLSRIYYDPHELRVFEEIESEWPLFYTYLLLDAIFSDDVAAIEEYREKLERVSVDPSTLGGFDPHQDVDPANPPPPPRRASNTPAPKDNFRLLPELYFVPKSLVEAERANPGSQDRVPNENMPLVWAQSLWITARLLLDGLISPADMDPLGRRFASKKPKPDTVVQVVLLAENQALQARMKTMGIETQTLGELGNVSVRGPNGLRDALSVLGMNPKLGLTGRPPRAVGGLSTSKLYRIQGQLYAFLPIFLDREEFYSTSDPDFMVDTFIAQLGFIRSNWHSPGRPTITVLLTESLIGRGLRRAGGVQPGRKSILALFAEAKSGRVGDVRVKVGRMQEMIGTACIDSLDFMTRRVGTSEDWKRILSGKASFDANVPREKLQVSTLMSTMRMRKRSGALSQTLKIKPPKILLSSSSAVPSPADDALTPGPLTAPILGATPGTTALGELPTSYLSAGSAGGYFAAKSTSEDSLNEIAEQGSDRWGLREHVAGSVDMHPGAETTLALDLNDPSRVDEAIEALKDSYSLFDQADLLHYLITIKGKDYEIEGAGKASELLEEVYQKSTSLGLWNVVRQAAGLLHKVPSGLSYHVIDLLVRRLPISVGRGNKEFIITSTGRGMKEQNNAPSVLNSDALKEVIYEHVAEPREGAATVELIMALADASRSHPRLLEGVARLRTGLILDALVHELSRTYSCSFVDGIERFYQLSPTELRFLVRRLLETHDHCTVPHSVTPIHIRTEKAENLGNLEPEDRLMATPPRPTTPALPPKTRVSRLPKALQIRVSSAGEQSGNFALTEIVVDGEPQPLPDTCVQTPWSRGIVAVVVDATVGIITFAGIFDTSASPDESDDLAAFIEELRDGEIVALACKDDCSESLNDRARAAIEMKLGSKEVWDVGFRDSWCLVGKIGSPSSLLEARVPASEGKPTEPIELKVDMAAVRESIDFLKVAENEVFATSTSLAMIAPTLGEWYRRRAVDGSLNRVPQGFYRKASSARHSVAFASSLANANQFLQQVWDLLTQCRGLSLGPATDQSKVLYADPLVAEKTAEEVNFALAVESWLDAVEDPASREVVVELLMELELEGKGVGVVDLMAIVRNAIEAHWIKWAKTFVTDGGSTNVEDHARLATRIFEDLPDDEAANFLQTAAEAVFNAAKN